MKASSGIFPLAYQERQIPTYLLGLAVFALGQRVPFLLLGFSPHSLVSVSVSLSPYPYPSGSGEAESSPTYSIRLHPLLMAVYRELSSPSNFGSALLLAVPLGLETLNPALPICS